MFDLNELIEFSKSTYSTARIKSLQNQLLAEGLNTPLYIFGRNEDSAQLIPKLNTIAVIDDFLPLPATWMNNKVIDLKSTPTDALIINGVTNSKPRVAHNRLLAAGYRNVYYLCELVHLYSNELAFPEFVISSREDILHNQSKWQLILNKLSDSESRKTCIDILKYRISGDPNILKEYNYRPEQQYFEEFLQLSNEVFVDAGGFDGETSLEFASRYPEFSSILFFEPDPDNLTIAKKKLSHLNNVNYYPLGLSNTKETLSFSSGEGSASTITSDGDLSINVETLDSINQQATFIKMDLEGWELNALKGAKQQIKNNKPKLAIGTYHSPEDFYNVFEWIMSIRPDYKVSMRHYTESWTETVLYFY